MWGFGVKIDFPLLAGMKKDYQLDNQKAERVTFPFLYRECLSNDLDETEE